MSVVSIYYIIYFMMLRSAKQHRKTLLEFAKAFNRFSGEDVWTFT